jgi:hypothetical protein
MGELFLELFGSAFHLTKGNTEAVAKSFTDCGFL